jgi:NAD(P)-dependent dehydrogenase (short-subunit alcohol dehydrogenase family)
LFSQGLFLFAKKAIPLLIEAVPTSPNPPSLLITGATASLRGSAQLGAFAAGKFAVRALGQSLAREFGPKGVHVAHAVIDGVIVGPKTAHYNVNGGVEDGKIDPDAVSGNVLSTTQKFGD